MSMTESQAARWQSTVGEARQVVPERTWMLVAPDVVLAIEAERQEMARRLAEAERIISEETPIDGLDLVKSLRVEQQHVQEQLAEVEVACAVMREALEKIVPIGDPRDERNKLARTALGSAAVATLDEGVSDADA